MNAEDVLKYGHETAVATLKRVDDSFSDTPGACGAWSVKDIVAHWTSVEEALIDVINSILRHGAPTPTLDKIFELGPGAHNDYAVDQRKEMSYAEVVAEYNRKQAETRELIKQVPVELRRKTGTMPWYGEEYDLEDLIAYTGYGNKREHCGQIAVFCDRMQGE